jgi:hypothetical protein
MHDHWLAAKADEIQEYADKKDSKNFYLAIHALYGPSPSGSSPLLSADGSELHTDPDDVLRRWAEHFDAVLNRPSTINTEAIERLPPVPINQSLDAEPTLEEVRKAISCLSAGKAPGSDAIPADLKSSQPEDRVYTPRHRGPLPHPVE